MNAPLNDRASPNAYDPDAFGVIGYDPDAFDSTENNPQGYEPLARYTRDPYNLFGPNHLIDALPPMLSHESALAWLSHEPPPWPPGFRSFPLERRLAALPFMQEAYLAMAQQAEAFVMLQTLLQWGLSYRNPRNPAVMKFIFELATRGPEVGLDRQSIGGGGTAGLVMTGPTGTGKTSFLDRFCAYYSQKHIIHTKLNGRPCSWPQIPVIRIQCNEKATLTGLANEILLAIDRLLGTRHASDARNLNQSMLLARARSVCSSYFLGMLIVDDVQYLRQITSTAGAEVVSFFCIFMEVTGIPVVLTGTPKFRLMLAADHASQAKLTAKGSFEFLPLRERSTEYLMLVETLWDLGPLEKRVEMPMRFPEWFFFHTQGLPRLMRLLMEGVHREMAKNRMETISEAQLDKVAKPILSDWAAPMAVLRRWANGQATEHDLIGLEDVIPSSARAGRVFNAEVNKRDKQRAEQTNLEAAKTATEHKRTVTPMTPTDALAAAVGKSPKRKPKRPEYLDGILVTELIETITQADDPYTACARLGWVPKNLLDIR